MSAITPYTRFAAVYDKMGADRHSVKMTQYCFEIFREFGIRPRTLLDLCCGTGTALEVFAEAGLTVSGVDQSAHMLAVAAKKLEGRNVTLYQKSLPRFRLLDRHVSVRTEKFDVITCFYDSLNYLKTERQLKSAFQTVYRHLEHDGWFIFDMNTAEALKVIWDGAVYADAHPDLAWVWKNEYEPRGRSAICRATFFVRAHKNWERFDEVHREFSFPNTVIKRLLVEAGFKVKGFYRCYRFEKPSRDTYRIAAVAYKG